MRQSLSLAEFGGGLDLVSSLSQLQPGFTPNAMNFRIAQYGGIEKTLGYSAFATLGGSANELTYFEKKDATGKLLIAALATSWQKVDSGGTVTNIRTAMTTTTETTFVNYGDKVYGLDPQNIMASYDGASLTTYATGAATGPPKGIILGIWNNRMWVATATAGAIGMDIVWSDPADFTKWPAGNSVSLGGVGTSDRLIGGVPTADGLVLFTNRSTFMVYDSLTGANKLVDSERGCTSRHSLAVLDGNIYGVNGEGVFVTSGSFAQQIVSRRVDPLFVNESPTLTAAAGTAWFRSYLASFARQGSANNDLTLEIQGDATMALQYPAYCYAQGQLLANDNRLYFIDAADRTKIRRAFDGGTFAGAQIPCWYEMHFDNFGNESLLKRLHRVRVVGRGALLVGVKVDSESVVRDSGLLTFPAVGGGVWDASVWDTMTWGGYNLLEGWAPVQARGRRFSLRFSEAGSGTTPSRQALGFDPPNALGSAGVYQVDPHFTTSTRIR